MYNFPLRKITTIMDILINQKFLKNCSTSYKITAEEMEIHKHANIQENPDNQ